MTDSRLAALRAEHDTVRAQLRVRSSTEHFAHGAVSIFLCLVMSGSAGRLWWDFAGTDYLTLTVGAMMGAAGTLVYATIRIILGARVLRVELGEFARLKNLRELLRLDDPDAQLPS